MTNIFYIPDILVYQEIIVCSVYLSCISLVFFMLGKRIISLKCTTVFRNIMFVFFSVVQEAKRIRVRCNVFIFVFIYLFTVRD